MNRWQLLLLSGLFPLALAADPAAHLDQPGPSPLMAPADDRSPARLPADNPSGAPTIPHGIDGQQTDLNSNRCLACHGAEAPAAVAATPLPPSHYRDRDSKAHPSLAGGRYMCTLCHVPQHRNNP